MTKTRPEQNKALVLEAFETLFNKRDYAGAERFWSDRYIQHSAHIAPGRAGLFDLVRSLPQDAARDGSGDFLGLRRAAAGRIAPRQPDRSKASVSVLD
jgi:hypothetical protein